jgi:hypothetical protein
MSPEDAADQLLDSAIAEVQQQLAQQGIAMTKDEVTVALLAKIQSLGPH